MCAVAACGVDLGARGVGVHDDGRGHPEQLRGEGDPLGVVPGGVGDDAAATLLRGELGEAVVGAAELERARALEVLALEEDVRARLAVGGGGGNDRRAVGHAAQALGGGLHVGEAGGEWRGVCHGVRRWRAGGQAEG